MSDPTTTAPPRSSSRAPSIYISPVLQAIGDKFRPKPSPACETCPLSRWFTTKEVLKCYCKEMHAIVYDLANDEVTPVLECDGREIAVQALVDAVSS